MVDLQREGPEAAAGNSMVEGFRVRGRLGFAVWGVGFGGLGYEAQCLGRWV